MKILPGLEGGKGGGGRQLSSNSMVAIVRGLLNGSGARRSTSDWAVDKPPIRMADMVWAAWSLSPFPGPLRMAKAAR